MPPAQQAQPTGWCSKRLLTIFFLDPPVRHKRPNLVSDREGRSTPRSSFSIVVKEYRLPAEASGRRLLVSARLGAKASASATLAGLRAERKAPMQLIILARGPASKRPGRTTAAEFTDLCFRTYRKGP
jgi:hypothetical protein